MIKHVLIIGLGMVLCTMIKAQQDTVSLTEIKKFAYEFDIDEGGFTGQGADTLLRVLGQAQYVMLGNHYRSYQEEVVASAITQELHESGFRNALIEIGPASSQVLNMNLAKGVGAIAALNEMNKQYGMVRGHALIAPIPDLKSKIAAGWLDYIHSNDWAIHGNGVESWAAYKMIIDHLFHDLPDSIQQDHYPVYELGLRELERLYHTISSQNNAELKSFSFELERSKPFIGLLNLLRNHTDHTEAYDALRFSMSYWHMYGDRKFYQKNKLSTERNKILLQKMLQETDFDMAHDKLLVRMWRQHMTKGLTSDGLYGIGNTLNELAELHGNKAVNIAIIRKFSKKNDVVSDVSATEDFYAQLFADFSPLGQMDKYVLIDLTKFNREFYWNGYHMSDSIEDVYKRYDYLIITKLDEEVQSNY